MTEEELDKKQVMKDLWNWAEKIRKAGQEIKDMRFTLEEIDKSLRELHGNINVVYQAVQK